MKTVFPVCCGVDVHKNVIVATIAITDKSNITHYIVESFSTINVDLYRFRTWLLEHRCFNVCMESTGKYWIPVFNILEEAGINVLLTHPKYVRAIKGKKTDKKDSKWISDLFKFDMVRSSFIPPKDIRALRELGRNTDRFLLSGTFVVGRGKTRPRVKMLVRFKHRHINTDFRNN